MIVLTNALMMHYGMSLPQAYCRFPLSAALALWPAMAAANGWEYNGPDFVARETIAAKDRMKAYLDENYQIIPTPKPKK